MAECDCVFLVRLVGGFQDAAYLYMVLEAAMGGEFFLYMQVRTHVGTPSETTCLEHTCDRHHGQYIASARQHHMLAPVLDDSSTNSLRHACMMPLG